MPLIFQATAVARPAFYDRNPAVGVDFVGPIVVGSHGVTNRLSHTLPVTKKAWLDTMWCETMRSTVAGPVSNYGIITNYTPQAASTGQILRIDSTDNNVGVPQYQALSSEGFFNGGDTLLIQTFDGSTGGTVQYIWSCKYTVFDP